MIPLSGLPGLDAEFTTRFAPSPTGHLHKGHLIHIVYLFGISQALGARILFRMEDHDTIRCRKEYADSIREDLAWLFPWTDASSWSFQSDRFSRYEKSIASFSEQQKVYECGCSRREIRDRFTERNRIFKPGDEIPYDNFCRPTTPFRTVRKDSALRLILPSATVAFQDFYRGKIEENPADKWGDLQIRNNKGDWTYQFAVSHDDVTDRVNLIVRGADILESTGRQIAVAKLLGREGPPLFFHHPILIDPAGRKLSKTEGDGNGLRYLKQKPEELLGIGAWLAGIIPSPSPTSPRKLGNLFKDRIKNWIFR